MISECKQRELFVFAGQSNMMGAAALPPTLSLDIRNSFEYKYKKRRLGMTHGEFLPVTYHVGEFAYCDIEKAYPANDFSSLSELSNYRENAYFVPALCNVDKVDERSVIPFSTISEKTAVSAPSLPPYFVNEWEKMGRKCAIAHMAKGSTTILHYFDEEMLETYNHKIVRYNDLFKTNYGLICKEKLNFGAASYFCEETKAFFEDAEWRFHGDVIKTKAFVWFQGESDAALSEVEYRLRLEVLWNRMKQLGYTHFFCIRVGFWGDDLNLTEIMKAQERFCAENKACHIVTRVCSFMPFPEDHKNLSYLKEPDKKYYGCRDSFLGFPNHHINEKGHLIIAKYSVANIKRILIDDESEELEEELITELREW